MIPQLLEKATTITTERVVIYNRHLCMSHESVLVSSNAVMFL